MAIIFNRNNESVKGQAFTLSVSLRKIDDDKIIIKNPTLAAGDITVSTDGGNFANITSLPTEIQSSGVLLMTLTASEMDGDNVDIMFRDVAGAQWADKHITIFTMIEVNIADVGNLTVAISSTQAAAVSSGVIAIKTHHTLKQTITSNLTDDLSTASKLWLAAKQDISLSDDESIFFVEKTAGLTRLNKISYAIIGHASIGILGSSGDWQISIVVDEIATGLLAAALGSFQVELKARIGDDTISIWDGTVVIEQGIVRALS